MVQAGSPRIVRSAVGSVSWARRARQSSKVSGHVTSAIASTHQPSEAAYRRPRRLRGTFLPFLRASDSPIAIACLRLLTLPPLPPFPLLKVPRFRRRIAPSTSLLAPRLYFRRPDVFRAILCPPYESVDEVSFLDQLAHLVGQHGQRDLLAVGLATDQRLRKMRQLLERDLGGHRRLEGIHDPLHNDRPGCGEGGVEGGATLGWILDGDAIAAAGLREKGEVDRVQVAAIFGIAQEDHLLPLYLAQRAVLHDHGVRPCGGRKSCHVRCQGPGSARASSMSSQRLDQAGPIVIWSGSSFTKWMGRSSSTGATRLRNASTRASVLRPVACSSSFRVIVGDTFVVARARRHRARKIRSLELSRLARPLRSIADSLPRASSVPRPLPYQTVGHKEDNRSQDRHDETNRIIWTIPANRPPNEATDHRAHDAQEDR